VIVQKEKNIGSKSSKIGMTEVSTTSLICICTMCLYKI